MFISISVLTLKRVIQNHLNCIQIPFIFTITVLLFLHKFLAYNLSMFCLLSFFYLLGHAISAAAIRVQFLFLFHSTHWNFLLSPLLPVIVASFPFLLFQSFQYVQLFFGIKIDVTQVFPSFFLNRTIYSFFRSFCCFYLYFKIYSSLKIEREIFPPKSSAINNLRPIKHILTLHINEYSFIKSIVIS